MQSKKIFLSTDVCVAFIDRAHPKHLHAGAFFRYFAQEKFLLFTNEATILETYMILAKSISNLMAKEFLKAISLSSINILYCDDSDLKLTIKTIASYHSSELQINEALMAVMANRRSIPYICTLGYLHPLFGLQVFYLPI